MDFKTIFRYQLSGTVFIVWLLVFNLSIRSANFQDIFTKISSFELSNIFTAVAAGIPIGTIIHQVSIFIKNCIFGKLFGLPYFIDSMKDDARLTDCIARRYKDLDASIVNDKITSTQKKMSDLNTFYYLRFDNGLIAPLFAYIIFIINESLKSNTFPNGVIFCISLVVFVLLLFPLFSKIKKLWSLRTKLFDKIKQDKWKVFQERIKKLWSLRTKLFNKNVLIIILFVISGFVLGYKIIFGDDNFLTNQNKSYISTEYYTTMNNINESIVSSYVTTNQISSIGYGTRDINNYQQYFGLNTYCPTCIDTFILSTGHISKIISANKYQTTVQTPVDNRLQVITEIIAIIYAFLMLMYIPVLYNQRRECWEYYFGVFNKYFVGKDVSINTHLFNEYQNGSLKAYIVLSIQDSNKNTNNDTEKALQKYSIDKFDVDKISHELVKQVVVNQDVTETKIKDKLKVIQNQFEIFNKQYKLVK